MADPPAHTVAHAILEADWIAGSEFDAHRPEGPAIRLDGEARSGPSPFDALLAALATCAASDVVSILQKQRTPPTALHVSVEAQRVEATPRRLASAVLHFVITAPGATQAKAARAVELAVTKYCSVRSSLLADVPVTWTIELNGSAPAT
jgi:putative redox protein